MQSPTVQPNKKTRSKSQSPPSLQNKQEQLYTFQEDSTITTQPSCSLEDILDFDVNETIFTAFEMQMQKGQSQNNLIRDTNTNNKTNRFGGGRIRRKFGRAQSMTFGQSTASSIVNTNRSLFKNTITSTTNDNNFGQKIGSQENLDCIQNGSSPDMMNITNSSSTCTETRCSSLLSLREDSNLNEDDDSSQWPLPPDLATYSLNFNNNIQEFNDNSNSSTEAITTDTFPIVRRGMMRRYSSLKERRIDSYNDLANEDSLTNSYIDSFNSSDSNINSNINSNTDMNVGSYPNGNEVINNIISQRRKVTGNRIKRAETLPLSNNNGSFSRPVLEPRAAFGYNGRSVRRSHSISGSVPQRSHSSSLPLSSYSYNNAAPFLNNSNVECDKVNLMENWRLENTHPNFNSHYDTINDNDTNDSNNRMLDLFNPVKSIDFVSKDIENTSRERKKICSRRHSIQGELFAGSSFSNNNNTASTSGFPENNNNNNNILRDSDLNCFQQQQNNPENAARATGMLLSQHHQKQLLQQKLEKMANLNNNNNNNRTKIVLPTASCELSGDDNSNTPCLDSSSIHNILSSPSNRSVASSSRKRGVCGGTPPSSDVDEWSIGGGGFPSSLQSINSSLSLSSRRRTRIFSPVPGTQFPIAPPLHSLHNKINTVNINNSSSKNIDCESSDNDDHNSHRNLPIADNMQDSDDDDEDNESSSDSSADDVSMEYEDQHQNVIPVDNFTAVSLTNNNNNSVFETMSSYDDLKFMIKTLRKENNGNNVSSTTFSLRTTWNVTPPTSWSSIRRNHFFQWAKINLGFTTRSAGMNILFLQISKIKGIEILHKLEEALIEHKQQEQLQVQICNNNTNKNIIINDQEYLVSNPNIVLDNCLQPCNEEFFSNNNNNKMTSLVPPNQQEILWLPSPMQSVVKLNTRNKDRMSTMLANEMSSLTMKDSVVVSNPSTNSSTKSITRMVTLEHSHHQVEGLRKLRDPRESMDSHCTDANNLDFMMHLHGQDSDNNSYRNVSPIIGQTKRKQFKQRPPKLSMDSVHTVGSGISSNCCNLTPLAIVTMMPMHNLEILATPLMEETRGWGSRPIPGKDWGMSTKCEDSILILLFQRFERTCSQYVIKEYSAVHTCTSIPPLLSNALEFDIEEFGDESNISMLNEDQVKQEQHFSPYDEQKLLRKRTSALNKRRRMSVWASATQNLVSYLPSQKGNFRNAGSSLCPLDENYKVLNVLSNNLNEFKDGAFPLFEKISLNESEEKIIISPSRAVAANESIVLNIFSFLTESDLLKKSSAVCVAWADLSTTAHANLMLASIGLDDDEQTPEQLIQLKSVSQSMERNWESVHNQFPWACYLAEGGAKKVYKVYNKFVGAEEAISVMDTHAIESKQIVANELAVSALLSSLSRRGICPNFVMTRGIFTCAFNPPDSHWGNDQKKKPKGSHYIKSKCSRLPSKPRKQEQGRYQYIRMELINEGDAEELIKRQPHELLDVHVAQALLFQIAFALHVAADRFSVKHYDIKLLNIFLQRIHDSEGDVVMRYGLGSHMFALRMPSNNAFVAKLADFGTANINSESNGQPVTIAQFTTLENTPPDFMILGDEAAQGHGHDNFGLGLCMLHLFTGAAPYEEILEDVKCPTNLKKRLRMIWENDNISGYCVINSLIHDGVVKDEAGHIIEGEPDETLYDTFYRYLVMFGIPSNQYQVKKCPKVWKAISDSFEAQTKQQKPGGLPIRKKHGSDQIQYKRDCKLYSLVNGTNPIIARARNSLTSIRGGMELLFRLCSFDPSVRASSMDVLNSSFMESLREIEGDSSNYQSNNGNTLFEYTAFSTHQRQQRKC